MNVSLAKAYKPNPLPRVLIYNAPESSTYKMFRTKNPKQVAHMEAFPYKKNGKKHFFIGLLMAFDKKQGYGSDFINFAKNHSKNIGCGGRVMLKADTICADPHTPPHIFYRKHGFTSDDKVALAKIDRHIEKNIALLPENIDELLMYYEPNIKEEKHPFFKRLLTQFKSLF